MAKRGRKKKSDAIKQLEGNPGKRSLSIVGSNVTGLAGEPAAAAPPIEPPPHLAGAALDEWRRLAPLLVECGKLKEIDRNSLAVYCQAWADYVRETARIAETGIVQVLRNDKGEVKASIISPHVLAALRFAEKLRQFGGDLGLSPQSRGELSSGGSGGGTGGVSDAPPQSKLALFLSAGKTSRA